MVPALTSTALVSPTQGNSSDWYIAAIAQLIDVVQELSKAKTVETVMAIVKRAARELTGADGATLVLRDGDQCYYVEENAIAPLWKGRRFPMSACISGWAMLHAQSVVIEDIYTDARIPQDTYRPTFVKSLATVPIRRNAPIGAIGNYWATKRTPSAEEIAILQALADTTTVALENAQLYTELQNNIAALQERERRIQEQHESLEIFTRALAHDLKEPARTISAFSDMISRNGSVKGEDRGYFNHIQQASARMLMLIETVFNYINLDGGQKLPSEACDMNRIVQEADENISQLIHERNATVTAEPLPALMANHAQMIQLFQNLFCNAIHHNSAAVTISVSAQRKDGEWVFRVADNGAGINADYLEQIFLPFKRMNRTEEGAGLGLSTCRKIVSMYEGKIWCESKPGQGTAFYFTVPKATEMSPAARMATAGTAPCLAHNNLRPASILLVDDRKSDLDLTRIIMTKQLGIECTILTARSGHEALEMLRRQKRGNNPINLAFLDINMPEMDGFDVLQSIRNDANLKDTAVIMCTGSTYDKDRQKAKSLGAAGYIVKPVKLDELKESVAGVEGITLCRTDSGYTIKRTA